MLLNEYPQLNSHWNPAIMHCKKTHDSLRPGMLKTKSG